ncbi:tetratricopeptide repeat protein [Candidatus Woesearchaeota archaeon]|nr:tetratricopeptide repeat protein [Candidatus Woesearchaeota archaeon]
MAKLSACLIVKNEEQFIANCLNSIKELADEIVIADTGSTDKTKEIVNEFKKTFPNLKLLDFKWSNDFSAARNFSIENATGDWILVIDADETVAKDDHFKIKDFISNKNYKQYSGFSFVQRSYTDEFKREAFEYRGNDGYKECNEYLGWVPSRLTRLFRNKKEFRFRNVIHELIEYSINESSGKIFAADVPVHHFKFKRSEDRKEKKLAMYRELLEKKVIENPENAKALFELGTFYRYIGKNKEAIALLAKTLGLRKDFTEAYFGMGEAFQNLEDYTAAVECYQKAIDNCKQTNTKFKDAYFGLGVCYTKMNMLGEAAEMLQKGLLLDLQNINALTNLGAVFEKLKLFDKAIASLQSAIVLCPTNARAYFNLGIVYEKLGRIKDSIKAYEKAVEFDYKRKEDILQKLNELRGNKKPEAKYTYGMSYDKKGEARVNRL